MRSLVVCSALAALGASAFAASPVPRPAPQVEIVDTTGKHQALSNYKGKVVVLQFLLTTCSHCQAYSQLLTKLQAEYGPRGFQALGAAAFDDPPATPDMVRAYQAKYAPAFPVGPLARETLYTFMGLSVMDRFGAPQIAVIDRKGQIREQTSSNINERQPLQDEPHLRGLIEKLLAEGSATPGAAVKTPAPAVATAKKP